MGTKSSWATESTDSTSSLSSGVRQKLKVLYDFEYETRGKRVKIVKDEQLVLVRKTNDDWWQVVRASDLAGSYYVPEQATFYVPTPYVSLHESDQLPEGTRFYVDKDKMFKAATSQLTSPIEQQTEAASSSSSHPPRKASHDSFKSKVIRKLSGNLAASSDGGSADKSFSSSKLVKQSRKNSTSDSYDEQPVKTHHPWESSAFGMCFGRDAKNVDAQQLNPFQEELENALSNRLSQKKIATSPSLRNFLKEHQSLPPPMDNLHHPAADSVSFESIQDKWQRASARSTASCQRQQIVRKINDDNSMKRIPTQTAALPIIKESKLQNAPVAKTSDESANRRMSRLSEEKPIVVEEHKSRQESDNSDDQRPVSNDEQKVLQAQDQHGFDIINDKRKMWAIETLMSELMQSSSMASKTLSSDESNEAKSVSGAKQLAQELHDMSVSRRFENAEIQVNLLDDGKIEEEAEQENKEKTMPVSKIEKRMFDFAPRSQTAIAVRSSSARSPKLLDEYNEANILNEAAGEKAAKSEKEKRRGEERLRRSQSSPESPSYSSVPLRLRRDNVPSLQSTATSSKPSKPNFRDELQLSPSLEKLASEIKFLPASWKSNDNGKFPLEATSTALDWPQTTTLSQDSLRLYKRRSKSEPQLLQRKSRSLGDLDCSEMDEREQLELRRRYKPVPKLRSKDSFKKILMSFHKPNTFTNVSTSGKPVPAKRRVHQQQQQHQHRTPNSSCDDLEQIDIERSTAVGFKRLLRASDSGSEECLQSKTFPSLPSLLILNRAHQNSYEQQQSQHHHHQQQSNSNDNLSSSRSLSSETILSSSSASARILDEPEIDNLVELPTGWRQIYDTNAKRFCFVNDRGDKWFSSNDAEGKIYFFEENSNESSWALPAIANESRVRTLSNGDWPQLFDGNMCILKEGMINKTKITTENGKKLRKAWNLSYAVLTELFLLFFKDAKTFSTMKMDQSAAAKPDITVDLNGAFIEPTDRLSNRRNVYLINTMLGLQVLIQSDNALAITEWYKEINDAIKRLPFSQERRRSTSSK